MRWQWVDELAWAERASARGRLPCYADLEKSDMLKNGLMGIFKGVEKETLRVDFDNVGDVCIGRETWFRRNHQGDVIGSVMQYPSVLEYGVTCHKFQGLTLSSEKVQCTAEFVPGVCTWLCHV